MVLIIGMVFLYLLIINLLTGFLNTKVTHPPLHTYYKLYCINYKREGYHVQV
jgi:hypothetical protein